MVQQLNTKNYNGGGAVRLSFDPERICPHCGTSFNGEVMNSVVAPHYDRAGNTVTKSTAILYVLHYCQVCSQAFFSVYKPDTMDPGLYSLVNSFPRRMETVDFDEQLKNLSPRFVKVYKQAAKAELMNLDELCGMGYRKALEFLIKDYLIFRDPAKADEIGKELLAASIRRIPNDNVQTLASRASWIGNDETHYIRKHEGLSYKEVKLFLDQMASYILFDLKAGLASSIKPIK